MGPVLQAPQTGSQYLARTTKEGYRWGLPTILLSMDKEILICLNHTVCIDKGLNIALMDASTKLPTLFKAIDWRLQRSK